jgi:hypothetical protein
MILLLEASGLDHGDALHNLVLQRSARTHFNSNREIKFGIIQELEDEKSEKQWRTHILLIFFGIDFQECLGLNKYLNPVGPT